MFDHLSAFQTLKLWLVDHSGLAKDALHVYFGLILLFGSAWLFGWKIGQWRPWLVVAAVALAGEAWDIRDVLVLHPVHDVWANWHDIWNTLFWPSAIGLLARYSRVLRFDEAVERD